MLPYFFGYGSLVNRATHSYPDAQSAQLVGWRRAWVRTARRDVVFLTVIPDPTCTIDGLIAAVPDADWAALDQRESGYLRQPSGHAARHNLSPVTDIAHYLIPTAEQRQNGDHAILLSYLDVVAQGFLREFGEDGVARFFATTRNWNIPIRNDRAAPMYPRHQALSTYETSMVDHHIDRLATTVV